MATLRIEIKGELGQISVRSFASVLEHSIAVLHSLDRRISQETQGTLHWVVKDIGHGSDIHLDLATQLVHGNRDYSPEVHGRFETGIRVIRQEEGTPPYFSYKDIMAVREIVRNFGRDGVRAVSYKSEAAEQPAELTHEAGPELNRLTGVAYYGLGSIEGRVEVVSVRRKWKHFNITEQRTGRTITCSLPYNLEDDVFEAIQHRRRIVASGRIAYNLRDEPMKLTVTGKLRFLGQESELPSIDDLAGSDKELTGETETEDYIRSLRDG